MTINDKGAKIYSYDNVSIPDNIDNKLLMKTFICIHFEDFRLWDYDESLTKCYLRFLSGSTLYVAEKLKGSKNINIYKIDRTVQVNDR